VYLDRTFARKPLLAIPPTLAPRQWQIVHQTILDKKAISLKKISFVLRLKGSRCARFILSPLALTKMRKPTHIAHIYKSHQPTLKPKFVKECNIAYPLTSEI